LFNVIL